MYFQDTYWEGFVLFWKLLYMVVQQQLFLLLSWVSQEAVPFDVCSWVFISSHFSLIVVWLSVKICELIENILSSSELNLLQETFKMILSNKLSRHFSLPRVYHPSSSSHHPSAYSLGLMRAKLNNKWPLTSFQSSYLGNTGGAGGACRDSRVVTLVEMATSRVWKSSPFSMRFDKYYG